MASLCQCELGTKYDKLECFKNNLRSFYKTTEVYDSLIEEQLTKIQSLDEFDFVNHWGINGFHYNNAIGGVVTANKTVSITTQILSANVILNRFFFNLSKTHTTYQKVVKLPESSVHTHVFQDSI